MHNFKALWGSCDGDSKVGLVFNWHIIKAPHSVIDYVVIHELCHLIYPNHSKDFWRVVTRHDPQCDQHRAWLRLRGSMLLVPVSA